MLTLPPYGSRLLVLYNDGSQGKPELASRFVPGPQPAISLKDWTLSFPGSAGSAPQPTERNVKDTLWTNAKSTQFYSGEVRYTTTFHSRGLSNGQHAELEFAPAEAIPDRQSPTHPGMRAWLDPPIREAAIVLLNGKRVGDLWHPPYSIDLTSAIRAGDNTLELRVFNTAINELAGQPPRDYTALKAKYGDRFQMQDMNNLQPVPSGIRGPVQIVYGTEVHEDTANTSESR
jgi:hypothetical protein